MEPARTVAPREDRILWIGEDPGAAARPSGLDVVVGPGGDVRAEGDCLPFADGRFEHVVLRADGETLAGPHGERWLRELEVGSPGTELEFAL